MAVFRSGMDPNEERRRRRAAALGLVGLSAFLAFQAVMVRSYGAAQKRPPSWDQAVHMEIALDYREAARSGRWSDIMNLAPKPGMPPFPPLYHLALMRAYDSPDPAAAALWVNWFYLAVLAVSLYFVCFAFRPDWAALGAVIAFICSPAIQELLFTQLIDLPVAAFVAAAYAFLIYSNDFTSWLPSLLFGATFGVGMLHKWSYFSYLIPAYLMGLRALSASKGRLKVLASFALALAIFFPWYYHHVAVLVPRLFQATSDFAVPVTQGSAFFLYFMISADTLGPALWVMGWLSLAVPNYRDRQDQSWLVWGWVLTSYLFWALVPNRQMRFLVPGLSGLAAGMCGAWPTEAIWGLAALQLFGAVNFANGWISPITIPLPLHDIVVLPNNAPAAEDWRIKDILQEAQKLADPSRPVADLTLVANAQYFNGPAFTWLARSMHLPSIRVRGVNKRLCEFSEFVVLKDDKLGPNGVIEGLPEASKIILSPTSWFAKGYERAGQWPLPDGSNAILYKQRRLAYAPFKGNLAQFTFYTSGPFTAEEFKAVLEPWNKEAGQYPAVRISASAMELRGVKVSRPSVELDDVFFVPASDDKKAPEWDEVRFIRMGKLKLLSAEITAADLKAYLEERIKGLHLDVLTLDKTVKASGQIGHFAFAVEAAVELLDSPRRLKATVLSARFGATPLPAGLMGVYREFTFPLQPSPETPFAIELPGLTVAGGKLTIP